MRVRSWVLIAVALAAVALAAAAGWLVGQRRDGLTQAAGAVLPSVVVVYPASALGSARRAAALGSGFVVDEAGRVVTNQAVLGEADIFAVELAGGRLVRARRIGADLASDLALLRLEGPDRPKPAQWGDSRTLRPGDWSLSAGATPDGSTALSLGVVTASNRRPVPNGLDYVQSDALAGPAAAGGPLVDRRGRVVGVVARTPAGFALGSEDARPVVVRMIEEAEVRPD